MRLDELNWLADPLEPGRRARCSSATARGPSPATVPRGGPDALELALVDPVRAITPGQSGVLYAADGRVLGGGVIG